jgi:hypothetical protein
VRSAFEHCRLSLSGYRAWRLSVKTSMHVESTPCKESAGMDVIGRMLGRSGTPLALLCQFLAARSIVEVARGPLNRLTEQANWHSATPERRTPRDSSPSDAASRRPRRIFMWVLTKIADRDLVWRPTDRVVPDGRSRGSGRRRAPRELFNLGETRCFVEILPARALPLKNAFYPSSGEGAKKHS